MTRHNTTDFLTCFIAAIIDGEAQASIALHYNNTYRTMYDIDCGDERKDFMATLNIDFLEDPYFARETAIEYYNEALLSYDKQHSTLNAYGYILETPEDADNFRAAYKTIYSGDIEKCKKAQGQDNFIFEKDIKNLIETFKYLGGLKITKEMVDTHIKTLRKDINYYNKWSHKSMQLVDVPLKTQ